MGGNKGNKSKSSKTKKEKKLSPVQQRFKDREAKGLSGLTGGEKGDKKKGTTTLGNYREQQRIQREDAARKRNEAFQANRNLKAAGGTSAQVAKDNAMYGNTVPAGSFNISPAGQAQAAANKQEKAAADMAARSQNMFSPPSGTNYGGITAGRLGTTFGDMFSKPKFMYQGNFAGKAPGLSNYFAPTPKVAATYTRPGGLKGIPFVKGDATGSLTRFKVPDGAKLTRNMTGFQQFKLNPSQMKNLGMGLTVAGDDVAGVAAKSAGKFGVKTLGKFGARAVPFAGAGLSIADSISRFGEGDYTGAALAAGSAIPGPVGWASLGGLAAKDITSAMSTQPTTPSGGLNIGAAANASETGEGETTSGSATGRTLGNRLLGGIDAIMRDTTDFDKLGVGNPASFGLENTLAGSVLNSAAQETGTINQFRKDTDNFSNLTNFNKLSNDEKVKTAQNVLKFTNDSQAAQALGEGLGLGEDFKTKLNDAIDNIQGRLEGVTADRNSLYGVTSDFARDIGTDPDLNPINKFLTAAATNNLGEAGKEPRKIIESLPNNINALGFNINNTLPINNEMARDIKAAFQDDSPTTKGLSAEQRGIIGSVGNRFLSGKATDGLREAIYGYGGREGATNAGLTEGQPLNFSDILDTAFAMKDNLGTGTTLASQRFDEGKKLTGPGGVTAGSLIRGSFPRFGGRRESSGSTTPNRGTGTTGTATPEELLIPQTPTYTAPTQTGTDSSNLQQIQQQSYMQNLAQLGITNLMQLPQFRRQQQPAPRRFRSFRRDYF